MIWNSDQVCKNVIFDQIPIMIGKLVKTWLAIWSDFDCSSNSLLRARVEQSRGAVVWCFCCSSIPLWRERNDERSLCGYEKSLIIACGSQIWAWSDSRSSSTNSKMGNVHCQSQTFAQQHHQTLLLRQCYPLAHWGYPTWVSLLNCQIIKKQIPVIFVFCTWPCMCLWFLHDCW